MLYFCFVWPPRLSDVTLFILLYRTPSFIRQQLLNDSSKTRQRNSFYKHFTIPQAHIKNPSSIPPRVFLLQLVSYKGNKIVTLPQLIES